MEMIDVSGYVAEEKIAIAEVAVFAHLVLLSLPFSAVIMLSLTPFYTVFKKVILFLGKCLEILTNLIEQVCCCTQLTY